MLFGGAGMANSILVLLVPADPLTALLAESGLQGYGYDVLLARSPAEALDLVLTNRRIQVLVVDADLSNGLTLAKAARSADPGMHVIYTSRAPNQLLAKSTVKGAPILRAPYHSHQLVSVISGLLRRPSADDHSTHAA